MTVKQRLREIRDNLKNAEKHIRNGNPLLAQTALAHAEHLLPTADLSKWQTAIRRRHSNVIRKLRKLEKTYWKA